MSIRHVSRAAPLSISLAQGTEAHPQTAHLVGEPSPPDAHGLVARDVEDEPVVEEGLSQAELAELEANLRSHNITYGEALGLTAGEMDAMEYRAYELLRSDNAGRALKIFVGLTKLNRFEARYFRGAGLAYHHMRNWGMAYGAYDLALATNAQDRASEALRAECLVYVLGKDAALVAFDALLAKPPTKGDELTYVQRASKIRQLLR